MEQKFLSKFLPWPGFEPRIFDWQFSTLTTIPPCTPTQVKQAINVTLSDLPASVTSKTVVLPNYICTATKMKPIQGNHNART